LHRLAELYNQRYAYIRSNTIRDFVGKYNNWQINPENSKEPQLSLKQAETILFKRLNVLRDLVSKFQNHPKQQEAMYLLASTMGRLRKDSCKFYFNQILKRYSKSEYAVKAQFGLAEYYFSIEKFKEAIDEYKKSIKYRSDIIKPFATYKIAWAYFLFSISQNKASEKEKLIEKAITAFKLAVLYQKDKDEEDTFKLGRQAASDLAWLWAISDDKQSATDFFQKHKNPLSLLVFEQRLADEYLANNQSAKAIPIYESLVNKYQTNIQLPKIYSKLIEASSLSYNSKKLLSYLKGYKDLFSNEENDWYDEYEDSKDLLNLLEQRFESLARLSGNMFFQSASQQKDKNKRNLLLDQTRDIFNFYISSLPKHKNLEEIMYNLAITYYTKEDFPLAIISFDRLISLPPKSKDLLKKSRFNKVLILSAMDSKAKHQKLPELGKAKKPITIPLLKKQLETAILEYIKIDPNSEEIPTMKYTIAFTYMSYGHYKDALKKFEALGLESPRTPQGITAVEILLSYLMETKNWDELVRITTKFLNTKSVKGKKLRDSLKEHLDYSKYMQKEQKKPDSKSTSK